MKLIILLRHIPFWTREYMLNLSFGPSFVRDIKQLYLWGLSIIRTSTFLRRGWPFSLFRRSLYEILNETDGFLVVMLNLWVDSQVKWGETGSPNSNIGPMNERNNVSSRHVKEFLEFKQESRSGLGSSGCGADNTRRTLPFALLYIIIFPTLWSLKRKLWYNIINKY